MLALATSTTPCAAAVSERPKRCARGASAASARPRLDPDRTAVDSIGIQVAEDHVGVGHRRRAAAEAVGRRPGQRARAIRPHLERARRRLHPRDGAAARADGLDGQHGQPHRVVAELLLRRRLGHAVGDQAHVGRRAAHVEGERAADPERARGVRGGGHAGRGARHGHRERTRLGRLDRHHAAPRVQEVQGAARGQPRAQVVEVRGGERHDRRIEHRGARALVLAELRVDLARDREVAEVRREQLPERLLVRGIGVGVQQADRDALDPVRLQLGDERPHLVGRERRQDIALRVHPLGHLEAQVPRHERIRLGGQVEAVEMRAVLPRDLEHVAEPARGDEAHGRDAPLDDGIGDQRRAVREERPRAGLGLEHGEPVQHARGGRRRSGRHLARAHGPGGIPGHEVREGAAHVDADASTGGVRHGSRRVRRRSDRHERPCRGTSRRARKRSSPSTAA